jgi:hypothetical protein
MTPWLKIKINPCVSPPHISDENAAILNTAVYPFMYVRIKSNDTVYCTLLLQHICCRMCRMRHLFVAGCVVCDTFVIEKQHHNIHIKNKLLQRRSEKNEKQ